MRQDGTLALVDPEGDIEAQRRQIKERMLLQAQQRHPVDSLWRIVRTSVTDRTQDPPVTWSNVFEDVDEPPSEELTNPFAQGDDRIPSVYPNPSPKRPERDDE